MTISSESDSGLELIMSVMQTGDTPPKVDIMMNTVLLKLRKRVLVSQFALDLTAQASHNKLHIYVKLF